MNPEDPSKINPSLDFPLARLSENLNSVRDSIAKACSNSGRQTQSVTSHLKSVTRLYPSAATTWRKTAPKSCGTKHPAFLKKTTIASAGISLATYNETNPLAPSPYSPPSTPWTRSDSLSKSQRTCLPKPKPHPQQTQDLKTRRMTPIPK